MKADDWKAVTVTEIAAQERNALVGGPFGSDLVSRDYVPHGVPVIRGANMGKGRWVSGDFVFVSAEKADSLAANCAKPGDLVFTQRGTIGQVALVPHAQYDRYLISQSQMKLSVDPNKACGLFLFYAFCTEDQQNYIQQNAIRTGVPHTNLGILRNTPVRIPSLAVQKGIARVLSTLDAKIELNQRINEELEGMAKLLYDYWFVQFDFPMTAAQAAALGKPKLTGKPYRASGGKMVYNQTLKREIPEGWTDGTAASIFTFNPSISLRDGTIAGFFDMDAVPTRGFMTKAVQRKAFSGGTKFSNGDVVIARITPCLENGKTALITQLEDGHVGFGSTEFIVMRGKRGSLSAFCACFARSENFRKFAILNMTGTSGRKRVEASSLKSFTLPIPPIELLSSFEHTCEPMFQMMTTNEKENQELTQLRDWLLPMLMNGQVTVGRAGA